MSSRQPMVCQHCSVEFQAYTHNVTRGWGKYCSDACKYAAKRRTERKARTTVPLICRQCGQEYQAWACKAASGRAKFCSVECRRASMRRAVERTCLHCGSAFMAQPSQIARSAATFCSQRCGYAYLPPQSSTRTCTGCNLTKPLEDFEPSKQTRTGRGARCIRCRQASSSHYTATHRQQINARTRTYRATNRERDQSYQRTRRARKRGAEATLTLAQWDAIKALFGYRCAYCGQRPQKLTQDHITPIARGGAHTAANVIPACGSCNSRKLTNPPPVPVQRVLLP
jgi:hypothetical protein